MVRVPMRNENTNNLLTNVNTNILQILKCYWLLCLRAKTAIDNKPFTLTKMKHYAFTNTGAKK